MTGEYPLDTNIVIALFAADEPVNRRLGQATEVFVPAIVLGELHFGARKSARAMDWLIAEWLRTVLQPGGRQGSGTIEAPKARRAILW